MKAPLAVVRKVSALFLTTMDLTNAAIQIYQAPRPESLHRARPSSPNLTPRSILHNVNRSSQRRQRARIHGIVEPAQEVAGGGRIWETCGAQHPKHRGVMLENSQILDAIATYV